MDRRKYC